MLVVPDTVAPLDGTLDGSECVGAKGELGLAEIFTWLLAGENFDFCDSSVGVRLGVRPVLTSGVKGMLICVMPGKLRAWVDIDGDGMTRLE